MSFTMSSGLSRQTFRTCKDERSFVSYLHVDDHDEFDEIDGLEFLASSFNELGVLGGAIRPHFRRFLGSTRPRFDEFAGLLDLTSTITRPSAPDGLVDNFEFLASMVSIQRPRVTSVSIVLQVYLTSVSIVLQVYLTSV